MDLHENNNDRCNFSVAKIACCVYLIDAGLRVKHIPIGESKDREIFLGWEILPDQAIESKSQIFYKPYPLKWSETSELRKDVQSWLGDELTDERIRRFAPKLLLGKYCNLELAAVSNDDGAQIFVVKGVTPLPIGIGPANLPKPVSGFRIFTISEPDMELLESLPVEIKTQIKNSAEYVWSQEHKSLSDDY